MARQMTFRAANSRLVLAFGLLLAGSTVRAASQSAQCALDLDVPSVFEFRLLPQPPTVPVQYDSRRRVFHFDLSAVGQLTVVMTGTTTADLGVGYGGTLTLPAALDVAVQADGAGVATLPLTLDIPVDDPFPIHTPALHLEGPLLLSTSQIDALALGARLSATGGLVLAGGVAPAVELTCNPEPPFTVVLRAPPHLAHLSGEGSCPCHDGGGCRATTGMRVTLQGRFDPRLLAGPVAVQVEQGGLPLISGQFADGLERKGRRYAATTAEGTVVLKRAGGHRWVLVAHDLRSSCYFGARSFVNGPLSVTISVAGETFTHEATARLVGDQGMASFQ